MTCRAFERAPRVPIVGPPAVSMFNERLRVSLSFLGGIIALRALDAASKYPLSIPARSKNSQEVWDAPWSPWVGALGKPEGFQVDGVGRKTEFRRGCLSEVPNRAPIPMGGRVPLDFCLS